ncbi:MAG: chitobiase/beta-hexosaminidase C-terminal domain-containing protein, partial [Prevotella sp.]|nr:chitobiase/beta-hexosaminidase C-terminal domain-containing protein [Prevotella sp.]
MKKFFTLICALVGFAGVANAATVDDIAVCKHSYVLVCDQLGARPGKGVLFGNDHFLDVTGGSTATNKGQVDLSVLNEADDNHVNQYIVDKYGADYPGLHYNFLRLKNNQDVIAMKLTAKSKVIMFIQGNNKTGKDARIPCIAKTVDDIKNKTGLNAAPTADHPTTDAGFRWEYTVDDDGLFYVGSYNGDMFVSYIIVEANEAPGTPTVKVGDQTFENGLWFREVSCKANEYKMEGSDEGIPTIVTYTTDGSEPNATSPVYKEPIKCYKDMTVK